MKSLSQWQPSWFLFPILTVRSSLLYISFLCLSSVQSATEINLLCISVICMRNCNILFVISLIAHNPDFFRIPFFIFADSWFWMIDWNFSSWHPVWQERFYYSVSYQWYCWNISRWILCRLIFSNLRVRHPPFYLGKWALSADSFFSPITVLFR